MNMTMRRALLLIILWGIFLAGNGQDLQQILSLHYEEARYEALDNMVSSVTTGRTLYSSEDSESSFTIYRARPDKVCIRSEMQGSEVIQTYNGITGWIYAPGAGMNEPEEVKGEQLRALLNQAAFDTPLWRYEEKGSRLELIPVPEEADYNQLRLTTSGEETIIFQIERESHLIRSIRSSRILGGTETEVELMLLDYERTRGIPVARTVQTRINGQLVTTMLIERVEFGRRLDPALFEKPLPE